MNWHEIDLLYELKSPVHIGYLPAKSSVINPTRYYIPGKNFWGAYTKVLTEKLFKDPIPKNYYDVGYWFKNNVKFTYFYIYDDKHLLVPEYSDKGLKYGNISLPEFQNRYIGSFISTGIEPTTGTAKDESLHDIEFIRPKYQSESIKKTRIFGKMFIKKDFSKNEITEKIKVDTDGKITVDNKDPFKVIFVGGELNYGFGKIEKLDSSLIQLPELGFKFDVNSTDKVYIEHIDKNPILSHLWYSETYQFCGDIELISGRGYEKNKDNLQRETHREPGKCIAPSNLCFTPGTVVHNLEKVEIDYSGVWNSL